MISITVLWQGDMTRFISLFLLLASLAGPAQAGPRDWLSHHKRFLLMESAALGASAIHASGLHHCRKLNGVEPCDSHYGAAWASFGITAGLTTIVLPATAEGCWKDEGGKWCNLLAYSGSAAQAGFGLGQWRKRNAKSEEKVIAKSTQYRR